MSREKQVMPTNFLGLLICGLAFVFALYVMFGPSPGPGPSAPAKPEKTEEATEVPEETTQSPVSPSIERTLPNSGGPR